MKDIRGNKQTGASRYDCVVVEGLDGKVGVTAYDGFFRERATANMDVKAAQKLVAALQAAITAATRPAPATEGTE